MAFQFAIALTGGIGTGKSTLSALLQLNGLRIIDADKVAHETLQQSSDEVAELFGSQYLDNGIVNRKKLGGLIFSDKSAKEKLENLLHPKIFQTIEAESEKLDKFEFPYLIDIPLFFETKRYPIEHVIVVYSPKSLQIDRVIKRDSLSKEEALHRIESQISIEKKREFATILVDNSGSLKELQSEAEKVVKKISELKNAILR
jgi:dephospho-CoA kinase